MVNTYIETHTHCNLKGPEFLEDSPFYPLEDNVSTSQLLQNSLWQHNKNGNQHLYRVLERIAHISHILSFELQGDSQCEWFYPQGRDKERSVWVSDLQRQIKHQLFWLEPQ